MSPCFRRTQWPSLTSIAGMMTIADLAGKAGLGGDAGAARARRNLGGQGVQETKFASSLKPEAWLFSGWNCTAKMLSLATAQVKGSPYSLSPLARSFSSGRKKQLWQK